MGELAQSVGAYLAAGFDLGEPAVVIATPEHWDSFTERLALCGWGPDEIDSWAVHAGGRSILDAVEKGLELPQGALFASRDVLARYGNMSSSTLMFVLAELIGRPDTGKGVALAFGPGLAAEGFHFSRAPREKPAPKARERAA